MRHLNELLSFSILSALLLASSGHAAQAGAEAGTRVLNRRLQPNQAVAHLLRDAGLSGEEIGAVVGALGELFDFRRARPGDQLRVRLENGALRLLDYRQGPFDEWQVREVDGAWVATKRVYPVEKAVGRVDLTVERSLYEATVKAGEDPAIAMSLAEVFAWDIDFYQDVRRGDRVQVLVEKELSRGRLLRYGEVLAARYEGDAVGTKEVFRYESQAGQAGYYGADGSSAKKAFLKSPLKFANVTSKYGTRFHPVLRYQKKHNGVDYAARVGTPVWAIADGRVTRRFYDRAAGNTLCIRHVNRVETCYLHLSKFARGLKVGSRVQQKQIVAYTGATGRITGPHLHYSMKKHGRFVNPLAHRSPRGEPVPADEVELFSAAIKPLQDALRGSSSTTFASAGY